MTKIRSVSIIMTLIFGSAVTLWGLSQMSWQADFSFIWLSHPGYFAVLLLSAGLVETFARWVKVNRLMAGVFVAGTIAIFAGAVWPLLVALWFSLASFLLGGSILSALRIDSKKLPCISPFLIGAIAYGTGVGLLAHYPVNYPGLYGAALTIPVLLGWKSISKMIGSSREYLEQTHELKWFDLAIALVALFHFSVALMPEVGHDALAMHLVIPAHMAHRQEWGFDTTRYVWAVMPMMGDWLFSIGYMLAGETAARIINVGFIFVLCWLIRDLVVWAGGNGVGARWAMLLFLTTPLTLTESSSLFVESVWASFVVAGALFVFKSLQSDEDQNIHLPFAGLLLGGALAAKAVTLSIIPALLILSLFRIRIWIQRGSAKALLCGLGLCVAVGAVPYVTAWLITGNPIFPFFNQIFQSPFYPAVNFDSSEIFGKGLSWDVLYKVTFHTGEFLESKPGASGFQWLLLFIPSFLSALFIRQYKAVILLVVASLFVIMTFQSVSYLRYVFPSFALLAAGIGVALSTRSMHTVFIRTVLVVVGLAVVALNLMFFKSGTNTGDLSLQALASSSGREAYLNIRHPLRNAVELTNRLNVGRTPVAVFSSPLVGGLNSDTLIPNWYNFQFQARVGEARSSKAVANLLMREGAYYVLLDANWGDDEKRKIIEGATVEIAEFGSIAVRRISNDYLYQKELLINPSFSMNEGWILSEGTSNQHSARISVSVSSPASQVVPVTAGRYYKNSATTVCADQPSQGRLQVNWLDSKSKFLSTDIRVFTCLPAEESHSMEVIAPRNAATAVVYASGHTNIPVTFTGVSFK